MNQCLVLLSPEPSAPTETFIRAHRDLLPFNIIPLYRWRAPFLANEKRLIGWLPGYLRALAERLHLPILPSFLNKCANLEVSLWLSKVKASAVLAEYGPLGSNIDEACRICNVPLIIFFHGYDAYQLETLNRYSKGYQRIFASASALIVPSMAMRDQLVILGAPSAKIRVNSYGVSPDRFSLVYPGDSPPHFLAIGRFVDKKAPNLTIKAFSIVHRALPSSRLTMIGAGPLLADCQELASTLGLQYAIRFLGACPHETVQAEVRNVRAVVQHSIRCPSGDQEGTPVALIEAQMAGVPVVSTFHAGIPDAVIHGKTGLLVSEGDVEGMAKAMLLLAQDSQLAAKLGAAARVHALHHHTMDRHINDLAATIRDAISADPTAVEA